MTWDKDRSLARIRTFKANVPEGGIEIEDFADEYLPRRRAELAKVQLLTEASAAAIVNIPRNRAILTNGVHIYAHLIAFGSQLSSERETEASFRRALQFLHLHYGACDRLITAFGLQRVDFHGARLHAVVMSPAGPDKEVERIARALAFARAFEAMVERTGRRFGGRFRTDVSIGIDCGKAIAINSGRGAEQEPLFIGRPANHAAHLAACDKAGVHLSDRVQERLAQARSPGRLDFIEEAFSKGFAARLGPGGRTLEETAQAEIQAFDVELAQVEMSGSLAVFNFHYRQPPLRTLDFGAHPPSNAVLMELAALFADIDGFTRYVDESLASGNARRAVHNLHVFRGELAACAREDFNGRKVRFIGDCLQAIVAEGDARSTDSKATVEQAILMAGGLRSSFDLCRQELEGVNQLGLAIGVEYGVTPACRIGLRGDASVRCVTSGATCESERLQQECGGTETSLGEEAIRIGGLTVQQAFGASNIVPNLNYPAASILIRGLPRVQVGQTSVPRVQAHSR